MALLFTADLHLGHQNILKIRPMFQNIDEHDDGWMRHVDNLSMYFESVDHLKVIRFDKKQITLCHYPMLEWSGSRHVESGKSYLVHGHIHSVKDPKVHGHIKSCLPNALNAGVDVNGFEPITFEELQRNNAVWYERGIRYEYRKIY